VVSYRRPPAAETIRPQVSLYHDRFDGDHRPVPVVRHASALVHHAHASNSPGARVERGDFDDGGDCAVERLGGQAGFAVRLFVTPKAEVPIVDAQIPRTAPSELRPRVSSPDVPVLDLEEVDMVERNSFCR